LHPAREGIVKAGLNLNPQIDGTSIRVPIPRATQELRTSLVKQVKEGAEEGRKGVRAVRQKALQELKDLEKSQGKDYVRNTEKKVQEHTDKNVKEIDTLANKKETEISTF